MIKIRIIYLLALFISLKGLSQNANVKCSTKDTTINFEECFCNVCTVSNKDNIKYYECFRKKDSSLYYSYTLISNALTGIKNSFNQAGMLYETESYINGFNVGMTFRYNSNGTVESKGKYKYLGITKIYFDTVCVEESSAIGIINCHTEKYSSPKDGKWIYYSDNGKKQVEGFYIDNKKVGLWIFYDPITGTITDTKKYE